MRVLLRGAIHCCPSIGLLRRVYPALVSPLCAMSSSKSADLDKSPDSWFAKFSRATETPQDCFRGFADRFNGITVDSGLEGTGDGNDFAQKLEGALYMYIFNGVTFDPPGNHDEECYSKLLPLQPRCSTGRPPEDEEFGLRSS